MSITRHQAAGAYRPWSPPSFDEAPETPVTDREEAVAKTNAPDTAPPPPSLPVQVIPAEPEVRLPTAEDIENIHEAARKEGYDAGYEEGTARGRMEAMQIHSLMESMEKALTSMDQEIAEELLALAIEVSRQIVHKTLSETPSVVIDTVKEAIQQLPQNHALVHLNPEDAILVREYLGEQLAHVGHRIVEDTRISRGGCIVEASGSQIDATVQTRWRRVLENLGRTETDWDGEQQE